MLNKDVNKLVSKNSPVVRAIVKALVSVAKENTPGSGAKVYFGWRNVMFTYGGMKKAICAIGPMDRYVNLYLMKGIHLKDPSGLLEGAGKTMRHVKVHSVTEARSSALSKLIRGAAAISRAQ